MHTHTCMSMCVTQDKSSYMLMYKFCWGWHISTTVIFTLTYPEIKWTCWGGSIGPFFGLGLIQLISAFTSLW